MKLQNGYKVIYEKTAEGKRTFYATENVVCDPAVDTKITEATIGEYKLIYEKDGQIYGSTVGVPTENDHCFEDFNVVLKKKIDIETETTIPVPVSHVFNINTLTITSDREPLQGTYDEYFNFVGTVEKRGSASKGVTSVELTKNYGGSIEFSTDRSSTVTIICSSTSSSSSSTVVITDTSNNNVAAPAGVIGSAETEVKFELAAAGTYRITNPSEERSVRIYTIEVSAN